MTTTVLIITLQSPRTSWQNICLSFNSITTSNHAVIIPQKIDDGARARQTVKNSPLGFRHHTVQHKHEVLVKWLELSAKLQR